LIEVGEMKMQMIQKKLMKMIHILKNMINQEFQHFAESQLIEVRKMKMHMIEFDSNEIDESDFYAAVRLLSGRADERVVRCPFSGRSG
jgi:hypothetical protein